MSIKNFLNCLSIASSHGIFVLLLFLTGCKDYNEIALDLIHNKKEAKISYYKMQPDEQLCVQHELMKIAQTTTNHECAKIAMDFISSQELLIDLACNSPDFSIRGDAIKRLTDQDALALIAKNPNEFSSNRFRAVEQLSDQEALAYVVRNDKESYVREAALKKLTTHPILVEIAKSDKEVRAKRFGTDFRIIAIEQLSDQTLLYDIAQNAKSLDCRLKATKKITNDKMLEYLYLHAIDSSIRNAALNNLSDSHEFKQLLFKNTALKGDFISDKQGNTFAERENAIKRLTNQTFLVEIAMNAKDDDIQKMAIKKITDQNALIEIAQSKNLNDSFGHVRAEAVKKITDQNALIEIAQSKNLNDSSGHIRAEAVKKITDQNTLIEIAMNANDDSIQKMAIQKINDQNALIKIAQAKESFGNPKYSDQVHIAAISKITDTNVLKQIARTTKDLEIRTFTLECIKDEKELFDVVKDIKDEWFFKFRALPLLQEKNQALASKAKLFHQAQYGNYKEKEEAIKQLSDETEFLVKIAKDRDQDHIARSAAIKQLNDDALLAEILKEITWTDLVNVALQKVESQETIKKIIFDSKYENTVRTTAMNYLTDKTDLHPLFETNFNDDFFVLHHALLFHITDIPFLEKIANMPDEKFRGWRYNQDAKSRLEKLRQSESK